MRFRVICPRRDRRRRQNEGSGETAAPSRRKEFHSLGFHPNVQDRSRGSLPPGCVRQEWLSPTG